MGVFVPVVPFDPLPLFAGLELNPAQILFFIGSLVIAAGIFTYS